MYPEWLKETVLDCSQQRHADKEAQQYEPKKVILTQFWAQELLNIPFVSRKYIRFMNHLVLMRLPINQFLNIEFPGKNHSVLPAVKKKKAPKNEEEKYNPAAPKKVIVIRTSLKQWLQNKRLKDAFVPLFPEPPQEPANPQSFIQESPIQMNVQIHEQQIPSAPPKNPFKPTDTFPKEKAPTLAELSKSKPKPEYQPLVFRPVIPRKYDDSAVGLGTKRLAPDGTEIHIYNKALYEPIPPNSSMSDGASGKPHKFGRSRKEARALMEEKRSARNSMLEPMSDAQSMSGYEKSNRDVLVDQIPPKQK